MLAFIPLSGASKNESTFRPLKDVTTFKKNRNNEWILLSAG